MEKGYFIMDNPRTIKHRDNEYMPSESMSYKMTKGFDSDLFDQPPSYTNDYLTPTSKAETSSAPAQPPEVPAFPAGGFKLSSQSSVASRGSAEPRLVPRADSGIEADFRRAPSTSSDYPRSSIIYESIDSNPHYVDPSPRMCHSHGHSAEGETSVPTQSTGVSSSGLLITSPSISCHTTGPSDSEDGGLDDDDVRRRLHPVYNSLNHSTPQLYTPACHGQSGKGSPSGTDTAGPSRSTPRFHLRCLCCGLGFLTVITLFLLAVLAYVFVFLIPGMQAHISQQDADIRRMALDYQNLSQKVDALLWLSTANQTTPKSDTTETEDGAGKIVKLDDVVLEMGTQLQNLSVEIQSLQLQVNHINSQPGLKDMQAVGSLAGCSRYSSTTTQALPGPASATSWLPAVDSDMMRDKIVMSVMCGVQGGTLQFVESRELSFSQLQYRCHCDGRMSGHDRRRCLIHLVLCPRSIPVDLLPDTN